MANGLENTSNTFVGNTNVGRTENATKKTQVHLATAKWCHFPLLSLRHIHTGVDTAYDIWESDMTPGSEQCVLSATDFVKAPCNCTPISIENQKQSSKS